MGVPKGGVGVDFPQRTTEAYDMETIGALSFTTKGNYEF